MKESCHHYGGRFCIYPWYSSSTGGSWHFGVHYPDTPPHHLRLRPCQSVRAGDPLRRAVRKNSAYCANVIRWDNGEQAAPANTRGPGGRVPAIGPTWSGLQAILP